jgi:hypothetical protein
MIDNIKNNQELIKLITLETKKFYSKINSISLDGKFSLQKLSEMELDEDFERFIKNIVKILFLIY